MICELYNKMYDILGYTFNGETANDMHENEISLDKFMSVLIVFIFIFVLLSWWLIPLRIITSPLNDIKFKCKRRD